MMNGDMILLFSVGFLLIGASIAFGVGLVIADIWQERERNKREKGDTYD